MAQYEIVIKAGKGARGQSDGYESTLPTNGGSEEAKTQINADDLKAFAKLGGATALATSMFKWHLSIIGRNTGNSDVQDKINASMELAKQGAGVITAFAVGGVVGGVLALAGVGLSYVKQSESFQYNRSWENIELGQSRYRAGPSLNRSRT